MSDEFLQKRVAELERLLNENVAARDDARLHRDYYRDAINLALIHLAAGEAAHYPSETMQQAMKAYCVLTDALAATPAMQEDS